MLTFARLKNILFENASPEPTEGKPLKHLVHLEDEIIHHGHEGAGRAADFLDHVHRHLMGQKTPAHVSTKYDGAPSIVYGTHPETGKFFVASKSAFNKDPKINYTEEDIERNHGHAPGLVAKMKEALHHLPKVMPHSGGVFQGDFMYGKGDTEKKDGETSFTPNTITYHAQNNSAEGKKIAQSKIGFVTHTEYKGKGGLENMSATPLSPEKRAEFHHHPDVNHIDPTEKVNTNNYTPDEQREFEKHRENARKVYQSMKPEAFDAIKGHGADLEGHINDQVRKGGKPSVEGYMDHLQSKHEKEISKLKTQSAIDKKKQAFSEKLQHINKNKEHFGKILELHHHLQQAKNVLTGVMAKNSPFRHTINGEPASPEGAVAVNKKGDMTKFVDRGEFARANLNKGKFQKTPQPVQESLQENGSEKHHVTAFMRTQPPTEGHGLVINKIKQLSHKLGADHSVVLSHSHDAKNPLSPEQKLKHAKRAWPGVNVKTSSAEHPNILHHLASLHSHGVTHLHLVTGQDRVEGFKNLINQYNGVKGPHGYYNFKNVNVVSAGNRDPDAEGTTGVSGTKMRAAAAAGDRETFHAGAPAGMKPENVDDMMRDTVAGLGKFAKKPRGKAIKESFLLDLHEVDLLTHVTGQHGFGYAEKFLPSKKNPEGHHIDDVTDAFNASAKKPLEHHSTMVSRRSDGTVLREPVHHGVDAEGYHVYMMTHPEGHPLKGHVRAIVATEKKGKAHRIETAVSTPGTGIHRLYHHLIVNHNQILTSDKQSEGGMKIWQKLQKMRGITMYGRDTKTGKVHNVDVASHPEETHVAGHQIRSAQKIKVGSRDAAKKKVDIEQLKKEHRMELVAHKTIPTTKKAVSESVLQTVFRVIRESR